MYQIAFEGLSTNTRYLHFSKFAEHSKNCFKNNQITLDKSW